METHTVSLVGFRAKNHPQQATRDYVDDRRTPADLFASLHSTYNFTVDAAASLENALLPMFWTKDDDALRWSWWRERVWCNPPYSSIEPWVAKAWAEMFGGCKLIVMLLPANRCEQLWWQRHVEPRREKPAYHGITLRTQFLAGRLRFDWPAGRVVPVKGDRPPFGCVLLTWENHT